MMDEHTPKAAKDKNCPFCHQAFTSSSLGRHLDLYIKPRNPKKPDGIHDVDEIRRTRGGVTRRQPKGSSGRRNTSTPAGTPAGPSQRHGDSGDESSNAPSPSKEGSAPATSAAGFPIGPGARWPAVNTTTPIAETPSGAAGDESRGASSVHGAAAARTMSRQAQKTQLDLKQKLLDAEDTARAAELALREFTNAWRAAKHQIDAGNTPFDFDPLTMNFPALTLQCLRPMPTLFASTQLPTPSSSWSVTPPGQDQFEALKDFFKDEFCKFRAKCAAQTQALHQDPRNPQLPTASNADKRRAAEVADRRIGALEKNTTNHLEIAYANWKDLADERKSELWVLELARGIATKQKDIEQLTAAKRIVVQENTNLKSQIEQLNHQQRPREFSITAPAHMPINDQVLFETQRTALPYGSSLAGLDINDRQSDYENFITSSIKRWKGVVKSARAASSGMSAQRPLGAGGPATPSATVQGAQAGQPRSRIAPPPIPVTFSVSTPASLAPTGGAQKQPRKNARAAPARQPGPRSSTSAPTAAAASTVSVAPAAPAASAAPSTSVAPAAPAASAAPTRPVEAALAFKPPPHQQAAQAVTAKIEPRGDEMDVEEEEDGDEEEEEGEEEEEDDEGEEDDEDGDDDTTPPAQQAQQAPTAPGAAGDEAPGGGDADDNDDEDDEMSDKDADAEMEDDSDEFAHMHTPLNMSASSIGSGALPGAPDQKVSFPYPQNANASQQTPRTAGNTSASLINSGRRRPNVGLAMPSLSGETMYMD